MQLKKKETQSFEQSMLQKRRLFVLFNDFSHSTYLLIAKNDNEEHKSSVTIEISTARYTFHIHFHPLETGQTAQ